jgi:8-oxo-dGTP pyrophosphatase MutT (NUDIX family)
MDGKEDEHPKIMVRNKISTSYGLVIYTIHKAQPLFLLTRRRDTFSYECILRGMYTPELLIEYVANTTADERRRLLLYDFENLWKDLWVSTRRRLYRAELRKAKECWEANCGYIRELIRITPAEGRDIWDFPKGRRFVEESTQECALREFEEETNLSKELVHIVDSAGSYEDNYQGTDHKMYRSVYYLGYIPNGTNLEFVYQPCPYGMRGQYISDEVMDIRWMDYPTALEMITPTRKKVLEKAYEFLRDSYQE